jgi:alanine racemase
VYIKRAGESQNWVSLTCGGGNELLKRPALNGAAKSMAEREAAKQPKILSFSCARPTVAEIDLGALIANYHALRALARDTEFMAVVKADAYGHGAVEVSHALAGEGCRHFGVATLGEAKELRAAGL